MLDSLPRLRIIDAISYGCMGRSATVPRTASASGLPTFRRFAMPASLLVDEYTETRIFVATALACGPWRAGSTLRDHEPSASRRAQAPRHGRRAVRSAVPGRGG